jgi:chorismate mutase/prephenate dehydratase
MFSTENVPGALYRALKPFASRNVNITKIESRPTKRKPWDYVFFLDFEGHREDAVCKEALDEMRKRTTFLKVLGSYPAWSSRRSV